MDINLVCLGGRLTRAVEVRYTKDGNAIAKAGMAVSKCWRNLAGEKMEYTSFFDLVAFGKRAENLAKFFQKGERIVVEGRLTQERWEHVDDATKETTNRSRVTIQVEQFHFVELKGDSADAPGSDNGNDTVPEAEKAAVPFTPPSDAPAATQPSLAGVPAGTPNQHSEDVPF